MKILLLSAALLWVAIASATAQPGTSAFIDRPEDPRAVLLTGAAGDGKADDSAAIQAAIDKAAADREEGIVFIPQGRYRISRTIYVWPAERRHRRSRPRQAQRCWGMWFMISATKGAKSLAKLDVIRRGKRGIFTRP